MRAESESQQRLGNSFGRASSGSEEGSKEVAVRKVNREGQRWTDDRPGMTLRLPIDLREAVTEESRVKGDLARIVLFALSHVEREKVDIMQTRKAGMELSNPQLLHVGAEARSSSRNGPKPKASASTRLWSASSKSSSSTSRKARRSGKNSGWRFARTGDLCRDYPIGSFLFWMVKRKQTGKYQFYEFIRDYHERDHRHNPKANASGEEDIVGILDGQQRLTALYVGLRGSFAFKEPRKRWDNPQAFPKRHLYLNLRGASKDESRDLLYDFRFPHDKRG
jgi:hypothetical protein